MATKRISDEPAYVLHRYDWSESSLILEVFTRHHGRLALVAKGVKRPSSSFRPILLPLQPLHLAFGGDAEIKTLKAAEWQGGHVMPTGDALMSGYYLNELLLKLLAREDPHPTLFDVYASVVQVIASEHGEVLESALRAFELLLLREIGLLPLLDAQTMTLVALHPQVNGTAWCPRAGCGRRASMRPRQPEWCAMDVRCSRCWVSACRSPTHCVPAPTWPPAQAPVARLAQLPLRGAVPCGPGK
jgi:recombinational DNA repair protein (RecF pathway)